MLDRYGDECNTQYVERIDADQPKGDEPRFFLPRTPCHKHDNQPYKRLLQPRATPHNRGSRPVVVADGVAYERYAVVREVHQSIHHSGYVRCQPRERGGDVPAEPRNLLAAFVAQHRELPEIVGSQQRCHKQDDVDVGRYVKFAFWHTAPHLSGRNRGRGT